MNSADLETLVEQVVLGVLEANSGLSIPGYPQETDQVRDDAPYYTVAARVTGEHIFNSGIYDLAIVVEYTAAAPVEITEGETRPDDPAAPTVAERSEQYAALFNSITVPNLLAVGFIGAVDMPQSTNRGNDQTTLDYKRAFTFTVIASSQPAS